MKHIFLLFFLSISFFSFSQDNISENCFTIAVGKDASATGSVLIAHNEDDWGDLVVNLHKVPRIIQEDSVYLLSTGKKIAQVAKTYEMLWIETTQQKFGDFYMNEWGVTICSNACQSKENKAEGKIGYDLRKIVAERAENAREGVEIAIKLINELGYESSGRTYCISDAYEVWFLAVVQGKHYVAQRLPDNEVAVIPNFYTIEEINLSDTQNFIASPDIISYAIEQGWYNADLGQPFNFREAYGDEKSLISERNTLRNIAGRNAFDFNNVEAYKTSFSIEPTKKVTIKDLELVLESHFPENSKLDRLNTPHVDNRHPICNQSTKFSVIVEFKNTYPETNQNVVWFAPLNPCVNPYVPIHFNIDSFPSIYQTLKWDLAQEHHFETVSNNYENNKKHAFSIFNIRNNFINQDYAENSPQAKRMKQVFEEYAIKEFEKNRNGETSFNLLLELYGNIKNFRH